MTDDLWEPTSAANPAAAPKKCRRHDWYTYPNDGRDWTACRRCGKVRDEAAASRGRRSAKRGKAIQRQRIARLGGRNLAGNNPNLDGLGVRFRYESKSGPGAFSVRYWRWLTDIPVESDQTQVLIVTEKPGPGRKARSYVVVRFEDWEREHGESAVVPATEGGA